MTIRRRTSYFGLTPSVDTGSSRTLYLRQDFGLNPSMSASALTTGIQNAINAAISAGHPLSLGWETWQIAGPLTINGMLTLESHGVGGNWGSQASNFQTINLPITFPPFLGGCLQQTQSGQDILDLTVCGVPVNLRNVGLWFDSSIAFTNTGYAINGTPPTYSTGHDNGISAFRWDNVMIYGHDGNHYGVRLMNPIQGTVSHLHTYGGGGLDLEQDSPAGGRNYGNCVFLHPYLFTCQAGSAHVLKFGSPALNSGSASNGALKLLTFVRPQLWLNNIGSAISGLTAPTNAQKLISKDSAAIAIALYSPDIETNIASAVYDSDQHLQIDGNHYIPSAIPSSSTPFYQLQTSGDGDSWNGLQLFRDSTKQSIRNIAIGSSSDIQIPVGSSDCAVKFPSFIAANGNGKGAPTLAMQAGAGTSPPTPTAANDSSGGTAQPLKGIIKFGTGTSPAAGALIQVTHAQADPFHDPLPMIMPLNAATQALGLYVSATSKSAYTVSCANAPSASQGATTYQFAYHCIA